MAASTAAKLTAAAYQSDAGAAADAADAVAVVDEKWALPETGRRKRKQINYNEMAGLSRGIRLKCPVPRGERRCLVLGGSGGCFRV